MPKKKPTEPGAELADETIRVPGRIARMIRIIAAVDGLQMGKVIEECSEEKLTARIREIERRGLLPK